MTLDEIADTVLPDRRGWFVARLAIVESFARIRLTPHRPVDNAKALRKELATLQAARELMAGTGAEKPVLLAIDREIWGREHKLKGGTWTPTDAKQHAAEGVLDAIALARGVHVGRLRPGRSPEDVALTQDSAIVHALLASWGLHEEPDTTFKRVRKAVASARPDADFEERTKGVDEQRPLPVTTEGTTPIVF